MTGSRTSSVKIFSVSSGVGEGDGFGFAGSWLEICVAASVNKAAMTRRPVVRFSHIVGIGCLMPGRSLRCLIKFFTQRRKVTQRRKGAPEAFDQPLRLCVTLRLCVNISFTFCAPEP